MGHQHFFGRHYMLDTENDQSWNVAENTCMHTARNGASESNPLIYPADNMSIDGAQYTHCNYEQNVADPQNRCIHTYISSEDYTNQESSSNYSGNPFNEQDLFDISVGNGRLQYKRKIPDIPDVSGSSADLIMHTEPWQETPITNFLHAPWNYHTTNVRNVRSRSGFDLETGYLTTNLENSLPRQHCTMSGSMNGSPSVDLSGQSSNGSNLTRMSSSAHEYELNPFLEGSSNHSSSVVFGQQNNNPTTRSSPTSVQSVRAVQSNHGQRPGSTFRVSSSNLQLDDALVTNEGLQLATNNYSSQYPRPSSTRSFRGVNGQDRIPREGHIIMDRSAFYGSRNPFDQHRDMRLDIDDMSYEELVALGERIGSVGTGVPEHLISKCVQESIYCSSDQIQEEGTCVVCLEEYANMDDIGMLRVCGHDFHFGCISKWLSMKNVCPICKAEPIKHK